ncbi:MAG: formate dehydrogenase subunit gamma [Deltaproteobacteria bacterium HGW-Deltaproteobacteria-1]|jgi:formate dehydrogenase subunit gamma|nr:MAG: formate dehydrogenase subunit gamma [Deltaproteobacteria bacterium HGW-Deltaproteobacteria-1]
MTTKSRILPIRRLVILAVLLSLLGGAMSFQVIGSDLENPRANFWRVVREGVPAYTSTPDQGHTVLIQNSGENWREIRNGLIARISPWIIILALIGMAAFYLIVGQDKLEKPRSGVMIERFTYRERFLHWSTALLFIVMAVTGLSLLLGRFVLIPIFGHWLFSGYLQGAKVLHNYCGPLLLAGILLEFVLWVRFNIPRKIDLQWFKSMGGMIGSGPRPHIGRVNAGEKGWFWLIFIFGSAVGITGVLLDFPIWEQTRLTMQVSHVVHAVVAVLFVTVSFGHIYMGTLGMEGAFEAMWSGSVDAVWAKQNHDLWYQEKMRESTVKPDAEMS